MRKLIVLFVVLTSLLASPVSNKSNAQQYQSNVGEALAQSPRSAPVGVYRVEESFSDAPSASGAQTPVVEATSAIESPIANPQDFQPNDQGFQPGSQQSTLRAHGEFGPGLTSSVEDPVVNLKRIQLLRSQAKTPGDALFSTSPLTPIRERFIAREKRIYEATDFKFGANVNTLFQGLTDNIPGTDEYGMGSFMQINATWDGYRKACPNRGEITLGVEGRWNYGTTDPTTLGNVGLGSLAFTSNPFTTYTPTFLVRNLFWRQGSRDAGWMYRIGRVTPDQFLSTSQHVTPLTDNLAIAGTGAFAMALPDSGMGMFGGFFLNDNVNIAGVVSDANANRTNFGQIRDGNLFTAVELQFKHRPKTKNAGYSKITFWHNDGNKFGNAINGMTGNDGWGFFLKGEKELSDDGRYVGLLRYGKSYRDSALYRQLAAGHILVYDPFNAGRFKRRGFNADLAGFVYSWIEPTAVDRDESSFEFFYRFALFPEMQATLAYQAIANPALDPSNDFGSAISLRLRSTW